MDDEQSGCVDSLCVAFPTQLLHRSEGMSPLHMNSPYTVSEGFVPVTVLLKNWTLLEALEDKEENRVVRCVWKVLLGVNLFLEQTWY